MFQIPPGRQLFPPSRPRGAADAGPRFSVGRARAAIESVLPLVSYIYMYNTHMYTLYIYIYIYIFFVCRLPLPTLFYRPEAANLGDLMRFGR